MFEFRRFRRDAGDSIFEKLAIKAAFATLLCIIAAEGLATAAQKGELPRVTLVWPEADAERLAKTAPAAQTTASVTIYRNIGIDGITTSTVPRIFKRPPALSPCDEESR
jgi:hypothetical protein